MLPGAALVGAGCGSYELITIKGLNEIRRAEVIVYDDLIDEHLLTGLFKSQLITAEAPFPTFPALFISFSLQLLLLW